MSAEGKGGREDIVRRLDVSEKEGERLSLPGQMISCKVQVSTSSIPQSVELN